MSTKQEIKKIKKKHTMKNGQINDENKQQNTKINMTR